MSRRRSAGMARRKTSSSTEPDYRCRPWPPGAGPFKEFNVAGRRTDTSSSMPARQPQRRRRGRRLTSWSRGLVLSAQQREGCAGLDCAGQTKLPSRKRRCDEHGGGRAEREEQTSDARQFAELPIGLCAAQWAAPDCGVAWHDRRPSRAHYMSSTCCTLQCTSETGLAVSAADGAGDGGNGGGVGRGRQRAAAREQELGQPLG